MTEQLTVTTERVDDIPLLLTQEEQMGLRELWDASFPAHGNWQGLSPGWVGTIWLAHILSEGDHRLNHVQGWVARRLETLRESTGQGVEALDFTDDRLACLLERLSDDARWQRMERALGERRLRVYDLTPQRVRLDSTSVSGYGTVTEEGLFQFGHSKDHRPDLPQVKVMLSTLDPMGMPVATQVVSGERADDRLYGTAIQAVRASLGRQGLLYVGDCKMAALATRAELQAGGDFYLCPLSQKQVSEETLTHYLQPVWAGEQPLIPIERPQPDGTIVAIAEGYETTELVTAEMAGATLHWTERRLVIRSLAQAHAAEARLEARLQQAQTALAGLNDRKQGKVRFREVASLQAAAEKLLKHYQVAGLLQVRYQDLQQEQPVRPYRDRPARVQVKGEVRLEVSVDKAAVQHARARLGWRVYATNPPPEALSLPQALLAYREEYLMEHSFGRLKGKPLSLTPMYLQDQAHVTGLIRLMSLGLRILTLLEFVVRRRLAARQETLAGLYAGNPKRTTARPTAEALLEAFNNLTLSVITLQTQMHRHLTPLTPLQQRILFLLDFPVDTYTRLAAHSQKPP